jgi:hypothetical protein
VDPEAEAEVPACPGALRIEAERLGKGLRVVGISTPPTVALAVVCLGSICTGASRRIVSSMAP